MCQLRSCGGLRARWNPGTDAIRRIGAGSDAVTLAVGTNTPIVLFLTGPDRVGTAFGGRELTLGRDGAGRITGFTLSAGRVRDIGFARR